MHKLALVTAISTAVASPVFAAPTFYSAMAISGTATDPLASVLAVAAAPVNVWYVEPSSGTPSNKTTAAIQLVKSSDWTFDFTDPAAVVFTGNIQLGDYKAQTSITGPLTVDGRQTFSGVTQAFSGVGSYNEATHIFTYNYFNSTRNGGGASIYSEAAAATCANGATSAAGKVCSFYATSTRAWEGLALSFLFDESRGSFTGALVGTETMGTSVSELTTTINWAISSSEASGPSAVPVPAAAWLFGSGLIGLHAARRKSKAI